MKTEISDNLTTILILAANPRDTGALQLGAEYRDVNRAIRGAPFRESIKLVQSPASDLRDVQEALMEHQPHVLHFSGHVGAAGDLLLHGKGDYQHPVSAESVALLLRTLKDRLQLVVFNACKSIDIAELVAHDIRCSIGMTDRIRDSAARIFSTAFYLAIAYARSVHDAFQLARQDMKARGSEGVEIPRLVSHSGDDGRGLVLVSTPAARSRRNIDAEMRDLLRGLSPRAQSFVIMRYLARVVLSDRLHLLSENRGPTQLPAEEPHYVVSRAEMSAFHDAAASLRSCLDASGPWREIPEEQVAAAVLLLQEQRRKGVHLSPEQGLLLLALGAAPAEGFTIEEIEDELPRGCLDVAALPRLLEELAHATTVDGEDAQLIALEQGHWRTCF